MKIFCIHAHFDDYEFVASGLFELWRQKLGTELQARVLVCTDGKAGHQFRTREETGRMRIEEQRRSAHLGQYQFQQLLLPDGKPPREACLQVSIPLLAALWKAIRDFEPDYIFCPPVPADPTAGIHVDHVAVAEAVRKVAYMINVPHAFTPEYPADETHSEQRKTPVILTLHDAYMAGANAFDLAVNVESTFEKMAELTFCHQSQIMEWLPWVGRHNMSPPKNIEEWAVTLRKRFERRNREMGLPPGAPIHEFFTVTAWGEVPRLETLVKDFPAISEKYSQLDHLEKKLNQWSGTDS